MRFLVLVAFVLSLVGCDSAAKQRERKKQEARDFVEKISEGAKAYYKSGGKAGALAPRPIRRDAGPTPSSPPYNTDYLGDAGRASLPTTDVE